MTYFCVEPGVKPLIRSTCHCSHGGGQMSTCPPLSANVVVIMVTLWNRANHYIFALWFLSFFFFLLFSSPNLSGCRLDVCHTSHTWCGLGANLECRSEMYCTRLAGNAGRKKSPSGHHRTNLSGYIFATKALINNRKKICEAAICPPHVPTIW